MANYYALVSTHKSEDRDSFYENTQLKTLNLSIGWGEINPINKSQAEIKKIIEEFYPGFKVDNPDQVDPLNPEINRMFFSDYFEK